MNQNPKQPPNETSTSTGFPVREIRYLILAVQREGNRWLNEMLRKAELTPAQAEVISILTDREPLTLAGLGKLLVCETGSPSRLVNSLVKKGLISQENHATDKRAKLFSLTPAGRNAFEAIREVENGIDVFLENLLSQEEKYVLGTSLYKILKGGVLEQAMLKRFHNED